MKIQNSHKTTCHVAHRSMSKVVKFRNAHAISSGTVIDEFIKIILAMTFQSVLQGI